MVYLFRWFNACYFERFKNESSSSSWIHEYLHHVISCLFKQIFNSFSLPRIFAIGWRSAEGRSLHFGSKVVTSSSQVFSATEQCFVYFFIINSRSSFSTCRFFVWSSNKRSLGHCTSQIARIDVLAFASMSYPERTAFYVEVTWSGESLAGIKSGEDGRLYSF